MSGLVSNQLKAIIQEILTNYQDEVKNALLEIIAELLGDADLDLEALVGLATECLNSYL